MYLHPTREQFQAVVARGIEGPVAMLNLLRFRDMADYSDHPDLAPDEPITGVEAYRLYGRGVMPLLAAAGGEVTHDGEGGPFLIGPTDETWDSCLLVRYPNVAAFGAMTSSEDYLAIVGHRMAALADSRLLPLT